MRVGDDVHQLPRFQPARPREHHQQDRILHDVPVARREHILAALVEDAVEGVARHVEGHGIGAGIQVHLFKVGDVVHMRDDAAARRVVFKVVQHLVYLVELPFREGILYAELIPVRLADGAAFVRPAVPDMGGKVMDIVALFLPDPEDLVDGRFQIGTADREDGELFPQVIAGHLPELFDRMGGRAVFPAGAHFAVCIPRPVFEDVPAISDEDLVCAAHLFSLPNMISHSSVTVKSNIRSL